MAKSTPQPHPGIAGLWTPAVTHDYLIALPAATPAVFLGRFANHRLSGGVCKKCVYAALCGIGALLLLQALRPPR